MSKTKKHTKLFKIGERAAYGKWRLTIENDNLTVRGIDWYTNDVIERFDLSLKEENAYHRLRDEFCAVTSHYFAELMIEWVEKHYGRLA